MEEGQGDLRQFFHRFIHRFTLEALGFTNKTMTPKISAKKVGDFVSVKAAEWMF